MNTIHTTGGIGRLGCTSAINRGTGQALLIAWLLFMASPVMAFQSNQTRPVPISGAAVVPLGKIQDQKLVRDGGAVTGESSQELDTDAPQELKPAAQQTAIPHHFGLWVLAPPLVAILLAIFFRQVVAALVVGVLTGAYMVFSFAPGQYSPDTSYGVVNTVVGGLRLASEKYILGSLHEFGEQGYPHLKIILFTLIIGFMVGVIRRNGGTDGMVRWVAGKSQSQKRGQFTAWLAGIFVFFDDYANTMIIGPTWQPVFDKLKLSRAKLAYIVDSTAAPVASLAIVGTWVGAEIGYINSGLKEFTPQSAPDFLLNTTAATPTLITAMDAFVQSIPYRFYAILALVMVLFIVLLGRDFGPMKKSESRALNELDTGKTSDANDAQTLARPRAWLGLLPILVLVITTIVVLILTGRAELGQSSTELSWTKQLGQFISNGDSYVAIFYGAILSALLAVILTMLSRACKVREAADAGVQGMAKMFPAIVILVLAWSLSAACKDLMLAKIVGDRLQMAGFTMQWAPTAIFLCAAGVSFATGTAWGTMGILCPLAVAIPAQLALKANVPTEQALPLFYAAVGSVLAGSVFGDHCSPISDTTVLSSLASGCRHEEHVWTQIPYAFVTALVAVVCGNILCDVYGQPWYVGLGAGTIALLLIVLIVGRRPKLLPVPATIQQDPQ